MKTLNLNRETAVRGR